MSSISFFTEDQVRRLTGLSKTQLRYWDQTGFFAPDTRTENAGPFRRLYSFHDLVGLRTVALLRKVHRVPLQELRRVGEALSSSKGHWTDKVFWVAARRVFFDHPDTGAMEGTRPRGQTVIRVAMDQVESDVRDAIARLRTRESPQVGQVTRNRNVAQNSWVVAGTRVPTAAIFEFARAGSSIDEIQREYPQLAREDITEAIRWEEQRRKKAG